MSKVLAQLLGKTEKEISKAVMAMEELTGYPSEDIRLVSDSKLKLRDKIAGLGLDPMDTTNEELYHSLLVRYERDSQDFDVKLGINDSFSFDQKVLAILSALTKAIKTAEVPVIKPAIAKATVRQCPPKNLMKQLNYRSLESLIKRESINEIFLAAPYIESASWYKNFNKKLFALSSTNYMMRPAQMAALPSSRYESAAGPDIGIALNSWVGSVGLWPSSSHKDGAALSLGLALLEGLETLTGKNLLAELKVINPTLAWWEDASHLLSASDEDAVSLNIKDIAAGHLQNHDFLQHSLKAGRQSFWNELLSRYRNYSETIDEKVAGIEGLLGAQKDKIDPSLAIKQLAAEYEMADK